MKSHPKDLYDETSEQVQCETQYASTGHDHTDSKYCRVRPFPRVENRIKQTASEFSLTKFSVAEDTYFTPTHSPLSPYFGSQNAGQIHCINIGNRSSENVAEFKYFGTTVTHQNLIQEEITRRSRLGNACCHSVQKLLSSLLLCKHVKIRIYIIIFPVLLYGCETWSLTLREEHGQRVLEKRLQRRIFGPKRNDMTGG
jgi:hypothetical protein